MSFGLLGAFFSRLISLQFTSEMTVEDAQNRYGLASLFIRAAVGMCGALVVYFLLGTNLLGTTVKPDYAKLGFSLTPVVTMLSSDSFEVLVPSADWCLLIMWSFLAGFSERLVPESLARAEGQISGTQKQP
jgi:dipeptide/tripeptide permease